MQRGVTKFARVKNGLPHFAEVAVAVDVSAQELAIIFQCTGAGWSRQGHVEDAPAQGYDDWKSAAVIGATFACRIAGLAAARVVVERISGLTTDTNPTIVAAVTALAVWEATAFQPPVQVVEALEAQVFASWRRPDAPVDFSSLA